MDSNIPRLENCFDPPAPPFWSLAHGTSPGIVTEDGRCLSYDLLQQTVSAIRDALDAPVKSLVFVLCSQSVSSLAGYLACLQGGHAALLLPHDIDAPMLEPLIAAYGPDFIWSPHETAGDFHSDSGFGMDDYRLYRAAPAKSRTPIYPDLALMLTTSGSTGNPKGVVLTHENLV